MKQLSFASLWAGYTRAQAEAIGFLAEELSFSAFRLAEALQNISYQKKAVAKKSGGVRTIYSPNQKLKRVQEKLNIFFYRWKIDQRQFGCRPEGSPVKNAKHHVWFTSEESTGRVPRWTLQLDLKDAFPSVTSDLLREMFLKLILEDSSLDKQVAEEVATFLVKLTTHNARLPQGAPTSPYLFNLVLVHSGVIARIAQVCGKGKKFSIYVDDLTVSSLKKEITWNFANRLIEAIEEDGWLKVNREKSRRNNIRCGAHRITGVSLGRVKITSNRRRFKASEVYRYKIALSQKTLNRYRGLIFRATKIMMSGRLPDQETDGMSLEQILGYIGWIKEAGQEEQKTSPKVSKAIQEFFWALELQRSTNGP